LVQVSLVFSSSEQLKSRADYFPAQGIHACV